MANTFEEQAKERFRKSLAFMQKSQTLLQDDLVFRSALADAVSAMKNMLQGYLLLRISAMPASVVTQRWQEVAISNRMPDLLRACDEAGLHLGGLERDIQRLNNERNYRTHDDPQRLVDPEQAERAYELALTVQRRIKAAVQGREAESVGAAPAPLRTGASRVSGPVRAAVSGTLAKIAPAGRPAAAAGATAVAPPPSNGHVSGENPSAGNGIAASKLPNVAAAQPGTVSAERDDEPPTVDDTSVELPAIAGPRAQRWRAPALLRALTAAALLIVGVVAGFGLSIPVASGHAPGFLGFAGRFFPTAAPASAAATLSPTATSPSGPVVLGALIVGQPLCSAGEVTITLANTGAVPLKYAIGSASGTATFALATPQPSAPASPQGARFDALAAGASVTLIAANLGASGRIVVVAPGGTVELAAPAC